MNFMHPGDKEETIQRYSERLKKYGYSEEALGWSKNKNNLRFAALTTDWKSELYGASVLDFGCGFGDLFSYLKNELQLENCDYTGVDINPDLISEGKKLYPEAKFLVQDILEQPLEKKYDFIFSSGVFNHKLKSSDEYLFIENCLSALVKNCNKGIAMNFLSDKVDYPLEHTFHSNPGKILDFFFTHSKHVVLKNDYMPFEFTVYLRLDAEIDKERVIFK